MGGDFILLQTLGSKEWEIEMTETLTIGHRVRVDARHFPNIHGLEGVVTEVRRSSLYSGARKYTVYLKDTPQKYHHLYGYECVILDGMGLVWVGE